MIERVHLIDTESKDLVFHSLGDGTWSTELHRHVWWAKCGKPVGTYGQRHTTSARCREDRSSL